jgi:hypothetical protein
MNFKEESETRERMEARQQVLGRVERLVESVEEYV